MYAILKYGVYLHDVYFVKDLDKGKNLLVEKVNQDKDEYHEWVMVEVEEGCELGDCTELYSIRKKVNPEYPKYDKDVVGINPKHYYEAKVEDLVVKETT